MAAAASAAVVTLLAMSRRCTPMLATALPLRRGALTVAITLLLRCCHAADEAEGC